MNKLTTAFGAPVVDNNNIQTAGPRGPALLQDVWFLEKLAHFDREVIPERRMHAKGSGAYGTFTVTHDITKYTRANLFSEVGKKTELFMRFSSVAGERGAADAERDIRGFAIKFYTEEGNWDLVGNNTPVFFLRNESEQSVQSLANDLLREVSTPYVLSSGHHARLGVSIGIAHVRPDGLTADDILHLADRALYRAKAQGKGQFQFATADD